MLSKSVFVRPDGTLIDGRGIVPDYVVEPDADYYLGRRDRMQERAIEVLKKKIDARKKELGVRLCSRFPGRS